MEEEIIVADGAASVAEEEVEATVVAEAFAEEAEDEFDDDILNH